DTVSLIDTASDTVAATVGVGRGAYGVSVKPDGSRAYVVNGFDDTVSVIDGNSRSVIATISLSPMFFPLGIAISPDGTKVYVAGTGSGEQAIGHMAVIDAALNIVTTEVVLPNDPSAAVVSADNSRVFVTNVHGGVLVIEQ